MEFITFDPLRHYRPVAELWERALGATYPVSERVLFPRIVARPTLEPGDGIVVVDGDRVAGFGIVEIDRAQPVGGRPQSIQALIIDPAYQRQGLGRALLARLEARVCAAGAAQVMLSIGLYRFWSGLHDDLPAAQAFFTAQGFVKQYDAIDLYGTLDGYAMEQQYRDRLAAEGMTVAGMAPDEVGEVCSFLTRELPGWRASMLTMVNAGDGGNMLVVRRGEEIIGCIQTFPPNARFRAANLVWERRFGAEMGGFGAVLIAKARRGQGLGTAMIQAAAQHVKDHGATGCFIDWTSHALAPFYGKVGTAICWTSGMYSKEVAAE